MSEMILCEKCGEQMVSINKEHTVGMLCPKCGWSLVTSYFDPISTNDTDYVIAIKPDNPVITGNIKLIADIANVNFLQAKKILGSGKDEIIYRAGNESASTLHKAQRVQSVAKRLKEAGIVFTITPKFPFEF